MRCCDVERLWDEMREGVEPQREHVLAHLRGCPECQEIYRENEGIAYCLTCLPPVDPPQSLVPKILDHIKTTVKIATPGLDRHGRVADRHASTSRSGTAGSPRSRSTAAKATSRCSPSCSAGSAAGSIPSQAPQWVTDTVAAFFRTHQPDLEKVDISELTPFEQSALRAAATIPPGEVRSYGWIAEKLGQPAAARAVGRAMARNPVALLYPCHRVVDASGALHQYAYGVEVKARILALEGYHAANGAERTVAAMCCARQEDSLPRSRK